MTKAYNYLIRLLSARDYSEYKLREKCRQKEFPPEDIDEAIQRVKDQNYLREDQYIEARIKGFMSKNCSPHYIQRKLKEEKLNVDLQHIQALFEEHQKSPLDQIRELIEKKSRLQSDPVKLIRFLLSKGHQYSDIKEALKHEKLK